MKKIGILFLLAFSVSIFGGTTGKISGKIKDAQSGEVLIGANVILTHFWIDGREVEISEKQGAASDANGEFYLLNINPGLYTVKVMMMGYGYQSLRVKINVDKTSFLDVNLSEELIEGEEVVVVAEKDKIQRDLTSSKSTISSDKIDVMAVENVDNIVELQAGVTDGHFRGGRLGEVSYMIDGVMVNNDYQSSRESAVAVETEAVQDILVISGTFNAEYGKAMSGIVNTITKEGGEHYQGSVSAYSGNYLSAHDDTFSGLDSKAWDRIKDYKFSLNGPIWKNKLTFFINGRYNEDGGYIYGVRRFKVDDYSDFEDIDSNLWVSAHQGDDKEVSLHDSKHDSFFGKLTFKPFSGFKMNFKAIVNNSEYRTTGGYGRGGVTDKQYHGDDGYQYKYNPDGMPMYYNESVMFAVNFNHVINTSVFYDLILTRYQDKNKRYVYENPLDSRYVHPSYSYKRPGFYTGGNNKLHDDDLFEKQVIKFDLNWQLNQRHGLKTGLEFARNKIEIEHLDIINGNDDTDGDFIPKVLGDESFYTERYTKKPLEFSAYIQDKMEFEEMIVNLGVRMDWFDPQTEYPTDYKNPDNSVLSVSSRSEYKNVSSEYQISPRLGIAYQLADAASLHFSYGHFLQIPAFYSLYQEHGFHVSSYNYETQMGNGRLKPEKTVSYEVGLQQKLAKGLVTDVSVYYRDIYNLLTVKTMETYDARMYGLYDNLDYATVKGLTLNLDYDYSVFFVNLNYTLQYAEGEASSPAQYFLAAGTSDPPVKLTRLSYDQRHTFNSIIGVSKNNLDASMILTWNSNYPYSYSPKTDDFRSKAKLPINNSTMPERINVDFSARYRFEISKNVKAKFYLEIYNLFDRKNEHSVFSTSGRAGSSLEVEEQRDNFRSDFSTIEEYFYRPDHYSAPRKVKIGIGFDFNTI